MSISDPGRFASTDYLAYPIIIIINHHHSLSFSHLTRTKNLTATTQGKRLSFHDVQSGKAKSRDSKIWLSCTSVPLYPTSYQTLSPDHEIESPLTAFQAGQKTKLNKAKKRKRKGKERKEAGIRGMVQVQWRFSVCFMLLEIKTRKGGSFVQRGWMYSMTCQFSHVLHVTTVHIFLVQTASSGLVRHMGSISLVTFHYTRGSVTMRIAVDLLWWQNRRAKGPELSPWLRRRSRP